MSLLIKDIDYKIIYKNIKNVNLRVDKDGQLVVSSPKGVCEQFIAEFVNKHANRILKYQERKLAAKDKLAEAHNKNYMYYLGKRYEFFKVKDTRFSYSVSRNKITLYYRNKAKDYDKMIRQLATNTFEKLNDQICEEIGANKVPIEIKKYKNCYGKNWGKEKIILNYKLVHLDTLYIKHVLYHEYAHMYEFNHSKKFYEVLCTYDSNFKKNKKFIDENFYKYL